MEARGSWRGDGLGEARVGVVGMVVVMEGGSGGARRKVVVDAIGSRFGWRRWREENDLLLVWLDWGREVNGS